MQQREKIIDDRHGDHTEEHTDDGAAPTNEADTTVSLGNLFVENDTMTFLWDYFWTDSTRLTCSG